MEAERKTAKGMEGSVFDNSLYATQRAWAGDDPTFMPALAGVTKFLKLDPQALQQAIGQNIPLHSIKQVPDVVRRKLGTRQGAKEMHELLKLKGYTNAADRNRFVRTVQRRYPRNLAHTETGPIPEPQRAATPTALGVAVAPSHKVLMRNPGTGQIEKMNPIVRPTSNSRVLINTHPSMKNYGADEIEETFWHELQHGGQHRANPKTQPWRYTVQSEMFGYGPNPAEQGARRAALSWKPDNYGRLDGVDPSWRRAALEAKYGPIQTRTQLRDALRGEQYKRRLPKGTPVTQPAITRAELESWSPNEIAESFVKLSKWKKKNIQNWTPQLQEAYEYLRGLAMPIFNNKLGPPFK